MSRKRALLVGLIIVASGLGCDSNSTSSSPASDGDLSVKVGVEGANAESSGKSSDRPLSAPVTIDPTPREPASVADAAQWLDLRTFPLLEGASVREPRIQVGSLTYRAPGTLREAFDFQRTHLKELGWKELPGTREEGVNPSATFTQHGFVAYVTVSSFGDPNEVNVSVGNYGNVRTSSLPVPQGAEESYVDNVQAIYQSTRDADEVRSECWDAIAAEGWEFYGQHGPDTRQFKKNAILLRATVGAPQPGKTFITYITELASADIPLPSGVESPQYSDSLKTLHFDAAPGSANDLFAFYRDALATRDWQATTDHPVGDDPQFAVYRNPGKEMITLEMKEYSDVVRVSVQHQTAEEVARLEAKLADQADKLASEDEPSAEIAPEVTEIPGDIDLPFSERLFEGEGPIAGFGFDPAPVANERIPLADVPVPPDATDVDRNADLEMMIFRSGEKPQPLAEFYRKSLASRGWVEDKEETFLDDLYGSVTFARGDESFRLAIQDGQPESVSRVVILGEGIAWRDNEPFQETYDDSPIPDGESEELTSSDDDLPIPDQASESSRSGSPYRTEATAKIRTTVARAVAFYDQVAQRLGWKESFREEKDDMFSAKYTTDSGEIELSLRKKRRDVVISLARPNAKLAREHDMVAPQGKVRLLIGNANDKGATIEVGEASYDIPAGLGAEDPRSARRIDVAPGEVTFKIDVSGENIGGESTHLEAGQSWGLIVLPTGGYLWDRLY